MSGNRNRNAAFVFTLSNLGSFIRLAQLVFGRGSGQEKRAAVLDVVGATLQMGLGVVAVNNPNHAQILGEVGVLIDAKVQQMKETGELPSGDPQPAPGTNPAPGPVLVPPPPPPDPTPAPVATRQPPHDPFSVDDYNRILPTMPPDHQLVAGDRIHQYLSNGAPDGWYISMHGIGDPVNGLVDYPLVRVVGV